MHPLKYENAGWVQHTPIAIHADECTPWLRPVIRAFAANIARIESAWLLLPYLVDTTMTSTALTVETLHTVLGTFDLDDHRQLDAEIKPKLETEFMRLSMKQAVEHFEEDDMKRALTRLDGILSNSISPFVRAGIETVLSSQILNAWTAVESLMKDLWETALNHGPEEWATKVMKSGSLKRLKEQEKAVSYSYLQEHRFDLRRKMGTILKTKLKFETVQEVVDAYGLVFGADVDISYTRDAILHVQTLEATRHLLAHRGGIVDVKFKGRMKTLLDRDLVIGKPLTINGDLAGMLTSAGVTFSMALVDLVDRKFKEYENGYWHEQI